MVGPDRVGRHQAGVQEQQRFTFACFEVVDVGAVSLDITAFVLNVVFTSSHALTSTSIGYLRQVVYELREARSSGIYPNFWANVRSGGRALALLVLSQRTSGKYALA